MKDIRKNEMLLKKTRGRFGLARTLIWTPPTPIPIPIPIPSRKHRETRTQTQTDKQVQSSRQAGTQAHKYTDKINAYANNWETWLLWLRTKMKKKMKKKMKNEI